MEEPAPRSGDITIRGTGLGAAYRPEILLGGRRVRQIRYAGPSRSRAGEDEIRFLIPDDAPEGCHVPVVVRTGAFASNAATVAIAPRGRPCVASVPWLESDALALLVRATMQSSRFGKWAADLVAARFGAAPHASSTWSLHHVCADDRMG